ncbi:hypothetical protein KY495_09540 [Massilia sp. PAMC28688]|uniref:hypothetical protein n=1 Tax=Massilia sp. PAMC28688 TaxID=2861283 RepID=UPI001C63ADAA|nr:hypothetical protein [Massilia sp. PAMC28688]QYF95368.1 hypothetical protein KY495_09540 [Massilia sp. PAMC28688]
MSKLMRVLAAGAVGAVMSGCYVMPLNQHPVGGGYSAQGTAFVPVAAVRAPFTARLYPANTAASQLGPASGMISNPEDGRGQFSFAVGGESFQGEATRAAHAKKGIANASGSRGGFVRCEYMMSSSAIGSGSCLFSGGARYDMHISQ